MSPVLEASHITVAFHRGREHTVLVDDVSFHVDQGECLGILGESGSGKSMTCKAVLGLLDQDFRIEGRALFHGTELTGAGKEALRRRRGKDIAMILQNPMNCFDPLYRIGAQMEETFRTHSTLSANEIRALCLKTLARMQIAEGEDVLLKYPHQLSGGMLQRVMIGIALAMEPALLVADEPTTAIDTVTQYEIMQDLIRVKKELGMAMIFISHDLGVISKLADRVLVMHRGRAVEQGLTRQILQGSADAYTRSLTQSRMAVAQRYKTVVRGGGA